MPPIRRYLRITKYSVLECRIYLDNPADAYRWLLNERTPVLPRVIEAVRPLVLPKLREENARAKSGKGGKKKGWKDIVVEDDFEVSIFLTETSSRHSILRKEKHVKSEKAPRLGTTDGKMVGGTIDTPVDVPDGNAVTGIRQEESEEDGNADGVKMADIPAAANPEDESAGTVTDLPKEETHEELFLSDNSASTSDSERDPAKAGPTKAATKDQDDKKKMALDTTYDGFSIYGRILCLVVKRKGGNARGKEAAAGGHGTGQAMMEGWIASTQAGEGGGGMDY